MVTIRNLFLGILTLCCGTSFCQTQGKSEPPQFSDFAAGDLVAGAPVHPVLATKLQRKFKTVIVTEAAKGPNFAGSYRIVHWGCGSDCIVFVVADLKTGKVYDPPFESLLLIDFRQSGKEALRKGLIYRQDSRMLIVDGCPTEHCGTFYYEWFGTGFKLLRSDVVEENK